MRIPSSTTMSKRKRQSHRRAKAARSAGKSTAALDPQVNSDAAGIDVGAQELVAAVPPGRGQGPPVRTFSAFTDGIHGLRHWLLKCKIRTVAMESTGNYWLTACAVLEDAGIEVCLVNARHVKGVPGKKTDVCDAAWLQQLHAAGLLRASFRPRREIIPLRYLMRHRADLVAQAGQQVQLMQKVMTEMNLHIHHVFSDVDGVSAQAIITAILAGERDPEKLAALRDRRCRAPLAKIIRALRGDYREEYLFVLRQCQARFQELCAAVAECDAEVARRTAAIAGVTDAPLPQAPALQRRLQKNMPARLPVYEEAYRLFGVHLSAVPGVSGGVLCVLMSELGTANDVREKFRQRRSLCQLAWPLPPTTASAADASSKPAPAKWPTESRTSCAWPPTLWVGPKAAWVITCAASKAGLEKPRALSPPPTNWLASSGRCSSAASPTMKTRANSPPPAPPGG